MRVVMEIYFPLPGVQVSNISSVFKAGSGRACRAFRRALAQVKKRTIGRRVKWLVKIGYRPGSFMQVEQQPIDINAAGRNGEVVTAAGGANCKTAALFG